jgi:hypothetical protein
MATILVRENAYAGSSDSPTTAIGLSASIILGGIFHCVGGGVTEVIPCPGRINSDMVLVQARVSNGSNGVIGQSAENDQITVTLEGDPTSAGELAWIVARPL